MHLNVLEIVVARKIALIPARGNSKRFPRKNIAPLGGRPLIEWTIEAALKSCFFDEIVLSSDDEETLDIGKKYVGKGLTLHKRALHLAEDNVTASEVLKHLIQERQSKQIVFDVCAILLPTCPFRSSQDILDAKSLLTGDVDSVVSMVPLPVIPEFIFTKQDEEKAVRAFNDGDLSQQKTRKQEYPERFYPNGAIYLSRVEPFLKNQTFFSESMRVYAMPTERSVDIDYKVDLHYAQSLLDCGMVCVENN